MPNILVLIELRRGAPTEPSLFALAEGRRVARAAGATLLAVVPTPHLASAELEALAQPIGGAGADKLLLCEGADLGGPPDDATAGRALDAAAARMPPALILLPAGGAGEALGPPLAARLGGPFVPAGDLVVSEGEAPPSAGRARVQVVRLRPGGRSRRRLDPLEIERPIVVALGAGRRPPPSGDPQDLEVEVLRLDPDPRRPPAAIELERTPDPEAAPGRELELASVVVLIADGAVPDPAALVAELAAAAPPGTVIARAAEVTAGALATAVPDVLLKVGRSAAATSASPRTRVVLAEVAGTADAAPDDVDVLFTVASAADVGAGALAPLLRAAAGEAP